MRLALPRYSGKDYAVLGAVTLPFTVALNSVVFGGGYFADAVLFLTATLLTGLLLTVYFVACGALAVLLKLRMPQEEQTTPRLFLMIFCFVVLSGALLLTIFHGYELFPSFNYTFNERGFVWAYVCMAIVNIFLTLVLEGISRYNTWKDSLKETEMIKATFAQSQLLGLKSQVNPHFLFNSLNALSSLIGEDEEAAEKFLNEMSKVYRYMLRGDDEQLVTLQTELRFVDSYTHLLEKRFGQSLQVKLDVAEEDLAMRLPPLSLQVLIENAFSQNSMTKAQPLVISVASDGGRHLLVRNNRQPKTISNDLDIERGLDNLVTKYRLLSGASLTISDDPRQRTVLLPLLPTEGGAA